jgi:hypothetical protein
MKHASLEHSNAPAQGSSLPGTWQTKSKATAGNGRLSCRVSQKGALSVYGLQRMPVTLYVEQWERLFGFAEEVKAFASKQNGSLSRKRSVATAAPAPAA